jgi:hypothetical protein
VPRDTNDTKSTARDIGTIRKERMVLAVADAIEPNA